MKQEREAEKEREREERERQEQEERERQEEGEEGDGGEDDGDSEKGEGDGQDQDGEEGETPDGDAEGDEAEPGEAEGSDADADGEAEADGGDVEPDGDAGGADEDDEDGDDADGPDGDAGDEGGDEEGEEGDEGEEGEDGDGDDGGEHDGGEDGDDGVHEDREQRHHDDALSGEAEGDEDGPRGSDTYRPGETDGGEDEDEDEGEDEVDDSFDLGKHVDALMLGKELVPMGGRDDYAPMTTEYDEWRSRRDTSAMRDQPASAYDERLAKMGGEVNRLRRGLERQLLAMERRDWDVAKEAGRLDTRRFAAVLSGRAHVFKARTERVEVDTAVTFLVDLSGSMNGAKAACATDCVIAFCAALDRTGVAYEVLGFSNPHYLPGLKVPDARLGEPGAGEGAERLRPALGAADDRVQGVLGSAVREQGEHRQPPRLRERGELGWRGADAGVGEAARAARGAQGDVRAERRRAGLQHASVLAGPGGFAGRVSAQGRGHDRGRGWRVRGLGDTERRGEPVLSQARGRAERGRAGREGRGPAGRRADRGQEDQAGCRVMAGWYEPKKKKVTVRADWLHLWPARGRDMAFWAAVGRRVRERGIRHDDAEGVRKVCLEVHQSTPLGLTGG